LTKLKDTAFISIIQNPIESPNSHSTDDNNNLYLMR